MQQKVFVLCSCFMCHLGSPCNREDTNQSTAPTHSSQADLFMPEFDATFGSRSSTQGSDYTLYSFGIIVAYTNRHR